ncbi:hypothetical protein [Rufibacter latericius]|uniref:Uncharacterized protein n=1 Tax=Rufibacter latericius TaxID=2487040 RepID=A0A3M9MM48_9BACT|nr:hypothetical protein [Rufibacter latericius]RNI26614.1 hypothetical protein EFB08_11390 [Rufibacter latericius]
MKINESVYEEKQPESAEGNLLMVIEFPFSTAKFRVKGEDDFTDEERGDLTCMKIKWDSPWLPNVGDYITLDEFVKPEYWNIKKFEKYMSFVEDEAFVVTQRYFGNGKLQLYISPEPRND